MKLVIDLTIPVLLLSYLCKKKEAYRKAKTDTHKKKSRKTRIYPYKEVAGILLSCLLEPFP